ncbi:MAG: response regulator transcription factor [Kiritimatiellaeota bacterium]|nr:response regulator transcription factor [Kiritimatiellota bacterium]
MKILLVEDDKKTAEFIINGLKQSGYVIDHVSDGEQGLFKATSRTYDAMVVDLMLPKMDGYALIVEIRHRNISTPIIILSAKNSVDDRIKGLNRGSDDYLVKPFSFSELLARLHALIRRANAVADPTVLKVATLTLDLLSRKVTRNDKRIDIQPLEFALLEYLMRHAGRVVSKTMIMESVWDYNFDPQTNVVEVRICKLREKIDKPFDKDLIHTMRGFGYVLEERT